MIFVVVFRTNVSITFVLVNILQHCNHYGGSIFEINQFFECSSNGSRGRLILLVLKKTRVILRKTLIALRRAINVFRKMFSSLLNKQFNWSNVDNFQFIFDF